MVKYECVFCCFSSNRKTEYSRHIKTKKHIEKVEEPNNECIKRALNVHKMCIEKNTQKCPFCDNIYSSSSTLSRHKKACSAKKELIKYNEIENLKKENERIQKEAKEKEEILKQQLSTYEQLLKSMVSSQTVNYYNHIVQNYPNAPALKCQESYTNLLESKSMTLVDVISMYHYDNKLVSFIGDYITKIYAREEPKNQSIWSTDISRLTYIISESCKNGNIWSYDKKGSRTKKIIIDPALQYIREQLFVYCQTNAGATKEHIIKKMMAATSTIQSIDSGELSEKINKYIAPEFSINPNDKSLVKIYT
ncbi:hypothetical protein Indivirus_1_187 [Indivirus ILV1]|uniref:Uncharacterized protein n=1 Tax=Indivirus ILV1 TaxID=1977633 RepID=A0A1V0SD58_9VIRU|nr:hypothetical protein Indivirus_1_187 [Indivirus ILV1]